MNKLQNISTRELRYRKDEVDFAISTGVIIDAPEEELNQLSKIKLAIDDELNRREVMN